MSSNIAATVSSGTVLPPRGPEGADVGVDVGVREGVEVCSSDAASPGDAFTPSSGFASLVEGRIEVVIRIDRPLDAESRRLQGT
jgi:hypothetical protein